MKLDGSLFLMAKNVADAIKYYCDLIDSSTVPITLKGFKFTYRMKLHVISIFMPARVTPATFHTTRQHKTQNTHKHIIT